MDSRDSYIARLEQQNRELLNQVGMLTEQVTSLNRQIESLTEIIRQMQREKFGPSSEKTPRDDDGMQLFMPQVFNEVEVEADETEPESCKVTREGKVRSKNRRTRRELILKNVPIEELIHEYTQESLICPQCGSHLREIGMVHLRDELQFIPASLKVIRHMQASYECPGCKHTDHPMIVKTPVPQSVLPHSLASASSIANVIHQKYVNGMPLYRQEKDWESLGICLSRATMANWCIRCNEEYFSHIAERFRTELLSRDIVHCDETPVQVLKEDGKKPQTKSYMWLYRTGDDGKFPVIIFDYKPSRSGDNAANFLKGFRGYVHSDGYSGYNKLAGITRCGCWAHLRRMFVKAIPSQKPAGQKTFAEIGRDYCDRLFRIEEELSGCTPEERFRLRPDNERGLLDEFWNWVGNLNPLPKSALGKAVTYALNQKPYMENYLLDGRLSISNNAAENAIRPFTVGRKNWLFSDTPKGASASASIYSIVETAKANGLDVYSYFKYLLEQMSNCEWRSHPELLDNLMPWSEAVREICRQKKA